MVMEKSCNMKTWPKSHGILLSVILLILSLNCADFFHFFATTRI